MSLTKICPVLVVFLDDLVLSGGVHLTDDEVVEINQNIRPFRETVYQEMKRLAYIIKETFPNRFEGHDLYVKYVG